MKLTTLPLRVDGRNILDSEGIKIADVALTSFRGRDIDPTTEDIMEDLMHQEANAAFIVKACNEYYPLIRVVKALVEKLDADVWFLETAKNEGICVESIKQIIKQAEES